MSSYSEIHNYNTSKILRNLFARIGNSKQKCLKSIFFQAFMKLQIKCTDTNIYFQRQAFFPCTKFDIHLESQKSFLNIPI